MSIFGGDSFSIEILVSISASLSHSGWMIKIVYDFVLRLFSSAEAECRQSNGGRMRTRRAKGRTLSGAEERRRGCRNPMGGWEDEDQGRYLIQFGPEDLFLPCSVHPPWGDFEGPPQAESGVIQSQGLPHPS